ncbi:MAG: bacterial proteasome activator family protein [Propionibacteriaceae bacterium]|nr:bacterial proteasome activator family protein [Propionibacteriaceae bacterium]
MSDAINSSTSAPASSGMVLGQGPDGEVFVLATPEGDDSADPLTDPSKVMRLGRMAARLAEEIKDVELDEAANAQLGAVFTALLTGVISGLSEPMAAELTELTSPFGQQDNWSAGELRLAIASLVGWMEGLFQGLQTALVAQHLTNRINQDPAAKAALLSSGASPAPEHPGAAGVGMYL